MNKSELAAEVTSVTGQREQVVRQVIDATIEALCNAVVRGESCMLTGLGTLQPSTRRAHEGMHPRSGDRMQVPARRTLRFHASKIVTRRMNDPEDMGDVAIVPPPRGRHARREKGAESQSS